MIYTLIENTLQELNPNALPLDDLAYANLPKLMKLTTTYTKGFINRYEYLKSVCDIMEYAEECISGFLVKRAWIDDFGECHGETLNVCDTYEEAEQALAEYKNMDEISKELGFESYEYGYAICERR